MAFYDNIHLIGHKVEGNGAWQGVFEEDIRRRALVLYANATTNGYIEVQFDGPDASITIQIQDGVMWEPRTVPTNSIRFWGVAGDYLIVHYAGVKAPLV